MRTRAVKSSRPTLTLLISMICAMSWNLSLRARVYIECIVPVRLQKCCHSRYIVVHKMQHGEKTTRHVLAIFLLPVLLTIDYLPFCGIGRFWSAHTQHRDTSPAHGLNVKDISIDRELVAGPWQAVDHREDCFEAGHRPECPTRRRNSPSGIPNPDPDGIS